MSRVYESTSCAEEMKASFKCVMDNKGDREACNIYFVTYKECKKRMTERKQAERKQQYQSDW